jgi:hypothetical protein
MAPFPIMLIVTEKLASKSFEPKHIYQTFLCWIEKRRMALLRKHRVNDCNPTSFVINIFQLFIMTTTFGDKVSRSIKHAINNNSRWHKSKNTSQKVIMKPSIVKIIHNQIFGLNFESITLHHAPSSKNSLTSYWYSPIPSAE